MLLSKCARGLHPVEPGRACAACAARNTAPAQWAARGPVRAPGAFVVAPRVEPSPPRQCAPLPSLTPSEYEALVAPVTTSACSTPGCAGTVYRHRQGPPPSPGTETLCQPCRKRAVWRRRSARLRGGAPALGSHAHGPERASDTMRAAALQAGLALAAHYGNERAACREAGVNESAMMNVRQGKCGPYVCTKLIEAAASLPRAA